MTDSLNWLEAKLAAAGGILSQAWQNREAWGLEVIYTVIDRQPSGPPRLTRHTIHYSPEKYFYPASAVKLPIAILALEKLRELSSPGIDRNTCMITHPDTAGRFGVYNEPNSGFGKPTLATYIRKIFLVSDNDAFNRLYEFVGQERINNRLRELGFASAEIRHRLAIALTEEENRFSNAVDFLNDSGQVIHRQPESMSRYVFEDRNDEIGKGYMSDGRLIGKPMDFSKKNRFRLSDLNEVLQRLVFPEAYPGHARFRLTEEDRRFLLDAMGRFPRESEYPAYQTDEYPDHYVKFLFPVLSSEASPETKFIRVFNKSGMAYGQLTDVAYLTDIQSGIEFFCSARMYCNADGILNDDKYDYAQTGIPFMAELSKWLFRMEKERTRAVKPDLSGLMLLDQK